MASIHTISLWLSHGAQIVTFCYIPSHFQIYFIGFFLHCCSLMAIFIRVACKLLRIMPNYSRTELPNDYSSPDAQIKVQFSRQTGARAAHGREMLNTLNTFLNLHNTLKSPKYFRKSGQLLNSTLFVYIKNSWLFWSTFLYWPAFQTHSSIKPTEN